MKSSATLTPPAAPPTTDAPPPVPAEVVRPPAGVAERNRAYRWALAFGLLGSVVVHLLVLRISPLFVRFAELVEGIAWTAPPPSTPRGMEVVLLSDPDRKPPTPPPVREPEPPPTPAVEPPADVAPEPVRRAAPAEVLTPRVGDWRLIVPPPLSTREPALTPAERAALLNRRVHGLLAEASDSAEAAARREAAALDWTVGEEGNRWGISPGEIHLGDVTLPLPFSLAPNPWQRREQAARAESYDAIQRQGGQAAIDETFEDRVKVIRERREAERKKAKESEEAAADSTEKKPAS